MRTLSKLAPVGAHDQRSPLSDILGHVKRVFPLRAERRVPRPLEGIDSWSDQAEVAFYEDCRASRCL